MTTLPQQLREIIESLAMAITHSEQGSYERNEAFVRDTLSPLLTEHEALQRKADIADEAFKQLEYIRIDQFTVKGDGANKLYPAHQYDEHVLRLISKYREATKPSDV